MSKVDPNLIEKQISVGHLKLLTNDIDDLERCKTDKDRLLRTYNMEKAGLLTRFKKLSGSTRGRLSDLFESVFMKDTDAAIIVGDQLFVRSFYNGYEEIDNVPYVNFDEAMEDTK